MQSRTRFLNEYESSPIINRLLELNSPVQDQANPVVMLTSSALFQEPLEADPIDMGQQEDEALATRRLDRSVQPEPLVFVFMRPRGTAAERTPETAVADFQAEAGLVHGKYPLPVQTGGCRYQLIF